MQVRKPPMLNPGDRLAVVSLSWGGPGTFPQRFEAGVRQLEQAFGVEVVPTRHACADAPWLRDHPEARAADLMAAFADPAVRGIVSSIGGDDSIRLLPHLDLAVIRDHPKVFLGYSDTTVSHFACLKAGLVSFYGPSILAGFAENGGIFPYTELAVRRTLFSADPPGRLEANRDGWTAEQRDWGDPSDQQRPRTLAGAAPWQFVQGRGQARGALIGGCVEVMDWLRGTPVWPDLDCWEGAILFLETSEEAPSPEALKRVLRCFAAMGVLERLSGILFARPGGDLPPADFDHYDEAVVHVVTRECGLHDLPLVTRMDFGHTDPMLVLPLGISAVIDCDRRQIELPESAVTPR